MSRLRLGAYLDDSNGARPSLAAFERTVRARCDVEASYWSWGLGLTPAPFERARAALHDGRIPLLTWEPWALPPAAADPARWPGNRPYALARIVAGDFDPYVDAWAQHLRNLGGEVYLRPMHEMNGNWYPWCGVVEGNSAALYRAAWRRLHGRFTAAGADNVRWVWSPYVHSVPAREENSLAAYFPGDAFVDFVGIDVYNWGITRPWSRWQGFAELFEPAYRALGMLSAAPIIIAEVGCAEVGGSKAAWLADAIDTLRGSFPNVDTVVWFNVDKECDWRLESSGESLRAFREAWSSASEPACR